MSHDSYNSYLLRHGSALDIVTITSDWFNLLFAQIHSKKKQEPKLSTESYPLLIGSDVKDANHESN